jgi:hypothetical protein
MTFERACYLATLCDSYSRLSKIVELVDELTEKDWLKLLGKFWTVCDNTGKGPVLELMTEHEIKFLNDLPEQINVYRGCYSEHNEDGISYSLSKDIAKRFPLMFYEKIQVGYVPMVRTGLVKKDDIIAYFNSRNEHEIVLRNVEIVDDEYL